MDILAVRFVVVRMGFVEGLGVRVGLGEYKGDRVGVTLLMFLFRPDRGGDLELARRDSLVSGRADLARLADADRGNLIRF